MRADPVRHPVLVDTDALIAVANTSLLSAITETLQLTTTNDCIGELERHVRETPEFAPEGSPQWLQDGSAAAEEPWAADTNDAFTTVTVVPRPHGPDAGETSLQQEVQKHPTTYQFAVLMDAGPPLHQPPVHRGRRHRGKCSSTPVPPLSGTRRWGVY